MAEDAVQSAEDQGDATASDSGLYNLDSVDPDIREQLVPHLKAIEGNVTKRFQEAADYRKGWAPYEELGVKDVNPETLQGLLNFLQVAENPQSFAEWWKAAGEEQGLFDQIQPEGADLGLEDVDDLSTDKIQELISEALAEHLNPIQERLQAQDQERQQQEASNEITQQLEQIRTDNPDLPEGAEDAIVRLAYSWADEDPENAVEKGFQEYKEIIGLGEKGLFENKSNQPAPAEGQGAADLGGEKILGFEQAKAAALQRLQQSH